MAIQRAARAAQNANGSLGRASGVHPSTPAAVPRPAVAVRRRPSAATQRSGAGTAARVSQSSK
eukprot:13615735-Alexandrium_andersonii.AAC.1